MSSTITSLDTFDDINKHFDAKLKQRLTDTILANGYNVRTVIDTVYEIPTTDILKVLSKLNGTIYSGNITYSDIAGRCIVAIETLKESLNISQVGVLFYSKAEDRDTIKSEIEATFKQFYKEQRVATVHWGILTPGNGFDTVETQTVLDEVVHPEAYPQIELTKYIEDYLNSQASVLLLIGPSGMGKTRFIRYIMSCMYDKYIAGKNSIPNSPGIPFDTVSADELNVLYSMDQKIFSEESFFMNFIQKDYNLMVLEDIDFNLKSRKQGNTFMYKLLGISDGLIKSLNKKIILSTNLPNQGDIDDALLRPGRCFGVVTFEALTLEQANVLRYKLNKEPFTKNKSYSVAECYNK